VALPELWTPEKGAVEAKKNAIISLYGTTKVGKTNLATRTKLPLYYAHFDPNDNLNEHLLARAQQIPDAGPAYPKWFRPVAYKNLTQDLAGQYVQELEQFAADARNKGEEGLFVIDGAKKLKGYIEKWRLGESTTLGFRAEAGGRGPAQVEYAATNAYLGDIFNAFVGSPLHLIVTFEARERWVEAMGDNGRKTRRPSGKLENTMPQGISYGINAQIEALVEAEPIIVNNQRVGFAYNHKLRFDWLGFVGMGYLRDRTIPATSFDDLLDLLHSNIAAEEVLEPAHEVVRADMAGLEPTDAEV
jgi:hypothetical protein